MRARDAIARVFEGTDEALSASDVIARVRALPGGDRWSDATLRTVLRALAPNAAVSRHYPSERRHGFLFALGGGRYRRWDVATDGSLEAARGAHSGLPKGRQTAPPPVTSEERERLVRALVEAVHEEPYQPQFRRRPYGDPVVGWPGRLARYFWPHPVMDLRATHELLSPGFDEAGVSRRLETKSGAVRHCSPGRCSPGVASPGSATSAGRSSRGSSAARWACREERPRP
jgi:hypothetical protein